MQLKYLRSLLAALKAAEESDVMLHKFIKNKKGSALLYVTVVIFFAVTVGGLLITLLTYEIKVGKITEEKIKAKYLAEAGIERGMLESDSTPLAAVTDGEGNTLYEYGVTISEGKVHIESFGYLNNERRVKIECIIEGDAIKEWKEAIIR